MAKRKFYQKKRFLIPFIIALALIFLGIIGAIHSSFYYTTANAYVENYFVKVTPKISGKIIELNFQNGSNVKKGEIIAELEGQEYKEKVALLEKQFEELQIALKSLSYIDEATSAVYEQKEEIEKVKLDLQNANNDYIRYKNEYQDGTVTKKDLEKAEKNLELAQEQFKIIQEKLENTKMLMTAPLQQARANLFNATITAPITGKITHLNAKIGDIINNEKPFFAIIPNEFYIIANFKKLPNTNLKVGQKANVKIYSAAFKKFNGEVVELLPENKNMHCAKIRITDDIEKYKIKVNSKAFVRIRAK